MSQPTNFGSLYTYVYNIQVSSASISPWNILLSCSKPNSICILFRKPSLQPFLDWKWRLAPFRASQSQHWRTARLTVDCRVLSFSAWPFSSWSRELVVLPPRTRNYSWLFSGGWFLHFHLCCDWYLRILNIVIINLATIWIALIQIFVSFQ